MVSQIPPHSGGFTFAYDELFPLVIDAGSFSILSRTDFTINVTAPRAVPQMGLSNHDGYASIRCEGQI